MNKQGNGFTLIELMVATTIFVSLMGMVTFAFGRLSGGGEKGLQLLKLHRNADAILRFMQRDLRNTPNISAICLRAAQDDAPGSFTFMKQVNDTHPSVTNRGATIPDYEHYLSGGKTSYRLTDLIWARWEWSDVRFKVGQSRKNTNGDTAYQWGPANDTASRLWTSIGYIKTFPSWKEWMPIKNTVGNSIQPMTQRYFKYFLGTGAVSPIDPETGVSAAVAGERIALYKGYEYTEGAIRPDLFTADASVAWDNLPSWRQRTQDAQGGDLRAIYTVLDCGNSGSTLADENAYAVRNLDGKSVNKDRVNLIGATDTDDDGNLLYPSQMKELFSGLVFFNLELIKRDGSSIADDGGESDTLGDGDDSYDVSGVDPVTGDGIAQRPIYARVSYLLHSIPLSLLDEQDFDGDGIAGRTDDADLDASDEESLTKAIYDKAVDAQSGGTRLDKIAAFKQYALQQGYAAIYITQSIRLGY